MRKIPTLYVRSEIDRSKVTSEVSPGCEWVLAGEGVATRKWDGTCVMYDGHDWFSRREVKPGKSEPDGYVLVETDPVTEKKVGWEPIENSGYRKHFQEALENWLKIGVYPSEGTYELIGPKISNKADNANPEHTSHHELVPHARAGTVMDLLHTTGDEAIKTAMLTQDPKEMVKLLGIKYGWEGLVWHHPNGSMVKLKKRDL